MFQPFSIIISLTKSPKSEAKMMIISLCELSCKLLSYFSDVVIACIIAFQVSEGLDFADHAGRAVVITGLPFATRTDPKV